MPTYHYVYILVSKTRPMEIYVGYTTHLRRRLAEHNAGEFRFTSQHRPWRLRAAIALANRERALDLERYLKTQPGRALISKRL